MSKIKTFDNFFWYSLLAFGFVVAGICYLPSLFTSHSQDYNFTNTGQIGDTIGGTMGPFVGIAAAMLTFLAFWVQFKANEQQKMDLNDQKDRSNLENFQNTFFELIKLHKENINELSYDKSNGVTIVRTENRRVFRAIINEFVLCYNEVKHFSDSINPDDYLHEEYKKELSNIILKKNISVDIIDLVKIDIAYSVIFFGFGNQAESVLLDRFGKKYKKEYFEKLLLFLKLKPKAEETAFEVWKVIRNYNNEKLKLLIDELHIIKNDKSYDGKISQMGNKILASNIKRFYYDGHQHRLGHYFRHLFQSFNFLDQTNSDYLSDDRKYFYGKIFRAQFSTYEQTLLFINSLSTLGMKWEFKFPNDKNFNNHTRGLITKYNLIANLPGNNLAGIVFKNYYPEVKYENDDQ